MKTLVKILKVVFLLNLGVLFGATIVFLVFDNPRSYCEGSGGCWDATDLKCRKATTGKLSVEDINLCWRNTDKKSCLDKNKKFPGIAKWDDSSKSCTRTPSQK